MTSIPQLHADINKLQADFAAAHARIAELEGKPETVREIKVPFEVVRVEYRDRPVEVVKVEYKDRIIEVPGPERVEYRDRPVEVVRYVDNPDLLETIEKLQAKVRGE